jgi:hypothetical protein
MNIIQNPYSYTWYTGIPRINEIFFISLLNRFSFIGLNDYIEVTFYYFDLDYD